MKPPPSQSGRGLEGGATGTTTKFFQIQNHFQLQSQIKLTIATNMKPFFIFVLLSFPTLAFSATIYKFIDSSGLIHYSNHFESFSLGTDGHVYYINAKEKPVIADSISYYGQNTLSQEHKNSLEENIKTLLMDPYSAHFKWDNNTCSCEGIPYNLYVDVNAKNIYGGYMGYTRYNMKIVISKDEELRILTINHHPEIEVSKTYRH